MATNYCPQCGKAVSAADRFCPACGATLADEAPTPAQAATRRSSKMPVAIVALAAVGLLLIVAGFFLNDGAEPQPVAEPPAVPATARPDADLPFPEVPRIALDEAAALQMSGDALFVDVREPADYAEAHIPDAVSIPLGDTELDPAYRELPDDARIITYCT